MKISTVLTWIVLAFILFPSCKEVTGSHIERDKMVDILYDLNIAESYSTFTNNHNYTLSKNTDSLAVYYTSVLKHHNVTLSQFQQSMEWYKNHTDELDSVYLKVSQKSDKMLNLESNKAHVKI